MYNFIPYVFLPGTQINVRNNHKNDAYEKYLNLSNIRNSIVHYASKNMQSIYDDYYPSTENSLSGAVNNCEEIIKNLFSELNKSTEGLFETPNWLDANFSQ